ncbi:hypothetical protein ACH5RR_029666, partial [Cinchona calisaya]
QKKLVHQLGNSIFSATEKENTPIGGTIQVIGDLNTPSPLLENPTSVAGDVNIPSPLSENPTPMHEVLDNPDIVGSNNRVPASHNVPLEVLEEFSALHPMPSLELMPVSNVAVASDVELLISLDRMTDNARLCHVVSDDHHANFRSCKKKQPLLPSQISDSLSDSDIGSYLDFPR